MADRISRTELWKNWGTRSHYLANIFLLNLLPASTVLHFHFPKYPIPLSSEPLLLKSMTFYLAKLQPSCRFITLFLCFISMGILER